EIESEFSLDRVGASPSVFDPEKLLWMNSQYMMRMPAQELLSRSEAQAHSRIPEREKALAAIELHRTRARTTVEMGRALSMYANDPSDYDPEGLRKQVKPETPPLLSKLVERYETVGDWTAGPLEATLRAVAEESGVSAGKLIHPTRLALTGTTVGAPLFDVVALLGKETTLRRLRAFLEAIKPHTPA